MSLSGRDCNTCLNHCLPPSKGQRRFRRQSLQLNHRPHRVRTPRLQFAPSGLWDFTLTVQAVFGNRSSFWVLWWVYEGPSRIETKSVTLDCGSYHGGIYNPRFGKCPLHIRGRSTRAIQRRPTGCQANILNTHTSWPRSGGTQCSNTRDVSWKLKRECSGYYCNLGSLRAGTRHHCDLCSFSQAAFSIRFWCNCRGRRIYTASRARICMLRDNWPVIWTGVSQWVFRKGWREGVPITEKFSVMSRSRSQGTEVTIVTGAFSVPQLNMTLNQNKGCHPPIQLKE